MKNTQRRDDLSLQSGESISHADTRKAFILLGLCTAFLPLLVDFNEILLYAYGKGLFYSSSIALALLTVATILWLLYQWCQSASSQGKKTFLVLLVLFMMMQSLFNSIGIYLITFYSLLSIHYALLFLTMIVGQVLAATLLRRVYHNALKQQERRNFRVIRKQKRLFFLLLVGGTGVRALLDTGTTLAPRAFGFLSVTFYLALLVTFISAFLFFCLLWQSYRPLWMMSGPRW